MSKTASLSPRSKNIITFFSATLFSISFIFYLILHITTNLLLNPTLYQQALAENHIYDRVYTDLLADPKFENATSKLLGNVGLEEAGPAVYSLATSTLYLILPPTSIQQATEDLITRTTDYLKGDIPELDARLNLTNYIQPDQLENNILNSLQTLIITQISDTSTATAASQLSDTQPTKLNTLLTTARQGQLTLSDIAQIQPLSQLSSFEQAQLTSNISLSAATAPEVFKNQINASLAAGDLEGAFSTTLRYHLADQISTSSQDLAQQLNSSQELDALQQASLTFNRARADIITQLNQLRQTISFLDQNLIPLTIVLMLASFGLIIWLHHQDTFAVLRYTGLTLLITSALSLGLWLIFGLYLQSQYPQITSPSPSTSVDYTPLIDMIADTIDSITHAIWRQVSLTIIYLGLIGILLISVTYVTNLRKYLNLFLAKLGEKKNPILALVITAIILIPILSHIIYQQYQLDHLPCNGHVELCNRPINQVAYATTHNSMSIAEYGWLWPSHDGDITHQLEVGIRGLLIDTHYFDAKQSLDSTLADAPEEARQLISNTLDFINYETREGTYLCHIICNIGDTPFEDTLTEIKDFLDANPREVIIIVIEDRISAQDTAVAFDTVGLAPHIYTHQEGQPWPTLLDLIKADTRLVVWAEKEGPPPAWYANAWDYTQETPYSFKDASEFSCEPNRGEENAPFFLLNHWIERVAPSRVDAVKVNDYDFLLQRAQQCQQERGQLPNLIGINFYMAGDVLRVVDTLNGVDEETSQ